MYDAIVVGLGPAGSTAAHKLASSGLDVLALDKESFPRYKSCGGCVSLKVEGLLDFDITPVIEDIVYGGTFTYKCGRARDILIDSPIGYNVLRAPFDHFLVEKAKEAGAEVKEGVRVVGVRDDGSSVTVTCEDGQSFTAAFLIGADGASGVVGRTHFGLSCARRAVSITSEVPYDREKTDLAGRLFIDFGSIPYGYGWIFPKKKVLSVGVAAEADKVGGRVKDYFNSFVKQHDILRNYKVDARVGWTVPLFSNESDEVVKGRVLLAGDTGNLVDPFLGEGIYYAIRTGQAAASAVAECIGNAHADPAAYGDWLKKEIYPEFRAAAKLAKLVYGHPRLWYSIVEKEPELMRKYYDVIRGEAEIAAFYEWVHGRIRSKPWKVLMRWVESRFMPT